MRYYKYETLSKRWLVQKYYRVAPISFAKIELFVSLNSLNSAEDPEIIKILSLLEYIVGQKSLIRTVKEKYVGTKKILFITFGVTLRNLRMYEFLNFFSAIVFPLHLKHIGERTYSKKENLGVCQLSLQNLNFFFGLKENSSFNLNLKFYGPRWSFTDMLQLYKFSVKVVGNK